MFLFENLCCFLFIPALSLLLHNSAADFCSNYPCVLSLKLREEPRLFSRALDWGRRIAGLGKSLIDLPPHANKVGPCNGLELCNMQICPDCANVRVRDDFVLFAYEACLLWCTGRIHLQLLAQGWILHSVQIGYIFSYPRLKLEVDFGSERYYRLRRLASK